MRRTSLLIATMLALGASAARAQSLAAAHDVLGDDPLARQIEQAPITSVTWVQGPGGQALPVLIGQPSAALGGAAADGEAAEPAALGGLSAQPGLAGLRDAAAAKKASKAPRRALKQARHIQTRQAW